MHEEGMPSLPVNQSIADRGIRLALASALFTIGVSGLVAEPLAGGLRIASLIPFVLGALGWCPVYEALGFSRARKAGRPGTRGSETALAGRS